LEGVGALVPFIFFVFCLFFVLVGVSVFIFALPVTGFLFCLLLFDSLLLFFWFFLSLFLFVALGCFLSGFCVISLVPPASFLLHFPRLR